MIIYKKEMVEQEVFDKFVCDRCKKEITDDFELQETHSICFYGGYTSIFGDENEIECDLCQQCLMDLIRDFYRVTGGQDELRDPGFVYPTP